MTQRLLCLWITLTGLGIAGCVTMPEETLDRTIRAEELSDHVAFLAQPALKGRKPLSRGSRLARQYIGQRFAAYGLKPWGDADSYAQPFVIGTNMIGVLPGSDPNLADEVVIVSAHYDHVGKTKDGLFLGACDNASGVAALLEIAEHLALSIPRPRRSICFAAFDREETGLLGAFAFSRREDFGHTKVAGVINIDMLGRHGFAVLDHHLFVVGTAGYPTLREALKRASSELQVLPVGTELVGARGDHVAFEGLGVCTLFFTCGLYRDYHRPGDMPEKIDYQQTRAASEAILAATLVLSESPLRLAPETPSVDALEELQALELCIDRIRQDPNALGWTSEQAEPIAKLSQQLGRLLEQEQWDEQTRRRVIFEHFDALALLLMWPEDPCDADSHPKEALQQHMSNWRLGLLNLDFRTEVIAAGQALIDHLNQHRRRRRWFAIPDFAYQRDILHERYFFLHEVKENEYTLTTIPLSWSLKVNSPGLFKWPPRLKFSYSVGVSWRLQGSKGTREELLDVCLLRWARAKREDEQGAIWSQVVCRVAAQPNERTYEQWLDRRLETGDWVHEDEWVKACMISPNPFLASTAIRRHPKTPDVVFEPTLRRIVSDRSVHPHVRELAMMKIHEKSERGTLCVLVDIVDDPSPLKGITLNLGNSHPLRDIGRFIQANQSIDAELWLKSRTFPKRKRKKEPPPKTVGEYAQRRLKEITGQNFGLDRQAWRQWIVDHR